MKINVEVLRCPVHKAYWAVGVNDRRITPSKCCGSWETVMFWIIDSKTLQEDLAKAITPKVIPDFFRLAAKIRTKKKRRKKH